LFTSLKNITISSLLLLAGGLSVWSILFSQPSSSTSVNRAANRPDAFMEEVVATVIGKEGKPILKVVSPKMVHYPENDSTDITTPQITVYRKESVNPWFINSTYAKATQGTDKILFWDNVVIHHPSDKDTPNTTMKTNSLTVFPGKLIAQTDDAIQINQPASTIHAIGMLANLNDGTVKLLSQAREEYVPNS
jgi:lipopolysaccharide export system protein LptC